MAIQEVTMTRFPMFTAAIRAALLFLIALLVLPTGKADAFAQLDFEQPYFVEQQGWQCKDHTVVKHEGLYHVFYIQSLPPDGHWMRWEKWFGHISSPDLRHWTQHANVMSVDVPNPAHWESEFVWAPLIMEDPNSSDWLMYYTGASYDVDQQVGLASSHNLINWYRFGGNPIYSPGSWAVWNENLWSNCRDPEVYFEPDSLKHYMFNTVSVAPDSMGGISLAESSNLSTWTDLGSFFVNDSQNVMESVQFVKREGAYHFFFTEEGTEQVSHISSPDLLTGFYKENRAFVELGRACEITPEDGEDDLWSRHRAVGLLDGLKYYYRFGRVAYDTADGVPEVTHEEGLSDSWSVAFGNAFNYQPTWGDNPRERGESVTGMEGNSYIGTYEFFPNPNIYPPGRIQGNVPTGMLRSTAFDIVGDRMRLLTGGGNQAGLTFVAMVRSSDNQILFWETGNDSHGLEEKLWNLSTLLGETVYMVIADLSTVAWGHIAVDSIEEYLFSGSDPITPSDPLADGPYLTQVLEDAGFGGLSSPDSPAAASARLLAPYPNPFNPRTRIRYELARAGHVELAILDSRGRHLRSLIDEELHGGPGFVIWDARDDRGELAASGVYFASLRLDGESTGREKLVLLK
jgi:hypothetical protein